MTSDMPAARQAVVRANSMPILRYADSSWAGNLWLCSSLQQYQRQNFVSIWVISSNKIVQKPVNECYRSYSYTSVTLDTCMRLTRAIKYCTWSTTNRRVIIAPLLTAAWQITAIQGRSVGHNGVLYRHRMTTQLFTSPRPDTRRVICACDNVTL